MFYDLFSELCKQRGITVTKATVDIGLSRTIGTKWKRTGAIPNGETLNKISAYFSVPIEYLLGITDEYGLTKQEWMLIGQKAKALRERGGFSIQQIYDEAKMQCDFSVFNGELSFEKIKDLEENGGKISPWYISVLCDVVGVDTIRYFYPQSRKLFELGEDPLKDDSPQAEARELSDDERELIDLVKSLTEDEVKELSRFVDYIISKRGTAD